MKVEQSRIELAEEIFGGDKMYELLRYLEMLERRDERLIGVPRPGGGPDVYYSRKYLFGLLRGKVRALGYQGATTVHPLILGSRLANCLLAFGITCRSQAILWLRETRNQHEIPNVGRKGLQKIKEWVDAADKCEHKCLLPPVPVKIPWSSESCLPMTIADEALFERLGVRVTRAFREAGYKHTNDVFRWASTWDSVGRSAKINGINFKTECVVREYFRLPHN